MARPDCPAFADEVTDLAGGVLPVERAAELRTHAAGCGACARLLAREEKLRRWLADPGTQVPALPPCPPLPEPRGRILSMVRWAAVSAAAVAAAAILVLDRPTADTVGESVETGTLEPRAAEPSSPTERWLAFDAGAEFVASRRVAEGR